MNHPSSPVPESGADYRSDIPRAGWKGILISTWKEAGEDNLGLVSAGVAFYAFLAFVPLLTAVVLSYGLVAEPASVVHHMDRLTELMPENAAQVVGDQLESMTATSGTRTGLALLLAIGIALYGASKGAAAVITALNIVFEVAESRGIVARTLMALAMTAGAVITLILAIFAVSALNLAEQLLPELGGAMQLLLKAVAFLMAASAVILLLAMIYYWGPNRADAQWRWISAGSALATLVWLGATSGFGAYVANFTNYNATYGSLGAIIVFLTWLYLSAYIVLLGAELNSVLEERTGRKPDAAPQAAGPNEPARRDPVPSLGTLAVRLGAFSILLSFLGQSRSGAARNRPVT
ncbi:YihY/virulence factor BrkB family protein [Sphingosinicella sp. CPCC 101087]|uniref:YihY/virulence factor BrkB family protein n=1 Tax=Sphingosinicella sp. CPCC 101087 TaxID=2497754 RepID=UPI0013EE2CFB|nr:YihY/virulence factor BrkB family protein [Sphingosinicella sp. CPCC 101087]